MHDTVPQCNIWRESASKEDEYPDVHQCSSSSSSSGSSSSLTEAAAFVGGESATMIAVERMPWQPQQQQQRWKSSQGLQRQHRQRREQLLQQQLQAANIFSVVLCEKMGRRSISARCTCEHWPMAAAGCCCCCFSWQDAGRKSIERGGRRAIGRGGSAALTSPCATHAASVLDIRGSRRCRQCCCRRCCCCCPLLPLLLLRTASAFLPIARPCQRKDSNWTNSPQWPLLAYI